MEKLEKDIKIKCIIKTILKRDIEVKQNKRTKIIRFRQKKNLIRYTK